VIEYLKNIPSEKELKELLQVLKLKPIDIVRKKESIYIEKYKNKNFNDNEWIKILVENPVLIERPIVVKGITACIARDEETVKKL
jgi:arsenate reductase